VTRYNLDGSGTHTFATGLRNSVGLAFNPGTGELWANNNDRDYLGDDLPPEHLNILKDGKCTVGRSAISRTSGIRNRNTRVPTAPASSPRR